VTHDPESTQKVEKRTHVSANGPNSHTIDFRRYDNCWDVNTDQTKSPQIKWLDSHSFIGCRVDTNSYVHVYAYGFDRKKPSHVLSHYNNIKNGEATLLSLRAEEISVWPGHTFYEIDHEDEELRFHTGGRPDHLWATFSFSRFTKRRYQGFHSAHQFSDVMIGVVGGFGLLFFMVYKLIAFGTTLFFSSDRSGYETQN
jgi:hypothetical protein